jgi:hypothetical protein
MKEDVKKKHFSTPLQEPLCGNLHPGPVFFRGGGFVFAFWIAA